MTKRRPIHFPRHMRHLATTTLAVAMLLGPGHAVLGDDDDHSVGSHFAELGSMELSQKNYDEILVEVTSTDGQQYNAASVNTGASSPMTFGIESQCWGGTSGNLYPPVTQIFSSGVLQELYFLGPEWFQRLTIGYSGGEHNTFEVNILNQNSLTSNGFDDWTPDPHPGVSSVEDLTADIKQMAIDLCNARLAEVKQNNPNYSDASAFIASGGVRELQWDNVKAQQICRHHRIYLEEPDGQGHDDLVELVTNTYDLTTIGKVQCTSPYSPPEPASNDLTVAFGVQRANMVAEPNYYRGACPVNVTFTGSVVTQGQGHLEVEIYNQDGELRLADGADVTSVGATHFQFVDTFDYPSISGADGLVTPQPGEGGPGLAVPQPDGDPAPFGFVSQQDGDGGIPSGPQDVVAQPDPPNVYTGWYRLHVTDPASSNVVSDVANYRVICERPEPGPQIAATPIPECFGGTVVNGQCLCENGQPATNGRCTVVGLAIPVTPIPCVGGSVVGGQCVCPDGLSLQNGQCVPGNLATPPPIACPEGQNLQNGQCVPGVVIDCAPGFILQGGICVQCPPGLTPSGNRCVASLPPGGGSPLPPNPVPPQPPPQQPPQVAVPPPGAGPQSVPATPTFPAAPNSQQVVVTCTGGTVENQQCVCPRGWTRETITIAPTAQIYNCRPGPAQ